MPRRRGALALEPRAALRDTSNCPGHAAPGVIRFAAVSDPQGAAFYVAKGISEDAPHELPMGTPGTIGWRELYAGEWKAAFAFYEKMFGWTKAESFDMGPMGTYQLFAIGDRPAGAMMTKPEAILKPNWGYYFNVSAIDAAAERVKAGGGNVMMGPAGRSVDCPMHGSAGRIFLFDCPQALKQHGHRAPRYLPCTRIELAHIGDGRMPLILFAHPFASYCQKAMIALYEK